MSMDKHLPYILVGAGIRKTHAELGMIIKQLIREVERVTERLINKGKNGEFWVSDTDCTRAKGKLQAVMEKLYKYETAEDEGRLVVLPCKPWDKVYLLFVADVIDKKLIYKIFQAKVTEITIDRFRTIFSFETLDENKYKSDLTMESFGETVFLTREEAENALKEMEGKQSE